MPTDTAPRSIDVRRLEGPHCETVLAAFDGLGPGESLVVTSDHAPRKLLRHLQADRKGEFEWSPLESGPERFRTEITRRQAARGARRDVTEALAWDHDRLEAIEARAFQRLTDGDVEGARSAWVEFALGLRRHIRFEEEILFPAFEGAAGFSPQAGPTAMMRYEHRGIEDLLDAIASALDEGRPPAALRDSLRQLLGAHNMKEEHILYPGTDRALGAEESDALVARIQAS